MSDSINKFNTDSKITWCPGCGNFNILNAYKNAFSKLKLKPYQILMTYGIGCHGHMVNYLSTFGIETLHGRPLPVAQGVKIANNNLNVISVGGDGDQIGEGGNHLIHAARRNVDITCIIHDNAVYALTTGQASPTSEKSYVSKTTPKGVLLNPMNPLTIAIASDASFVARGFANDIKELTDIITKAIKHKGFSFVEILQPCVTFNYINTYSWYKDRVYYLNRSYPCEDKTLAIKKSLEFSNKIPLGVLYKKTRPVFNAGLEYKKNRPLVYDSIKNVSINELLDTLV